jgi:oligopeptidase A
MASDPLETSVHNPLLSAALPLPWDRIDTTHVRPAVDALLARARERLASVSRKDAPRTYAGTLGVLDEATADLERVMAIVSHLEATCTSPAIRAAYDAVRPLVSEFHAGIPLDRGLWDAMRAYAATDEARALEPVRRRFLEKTMDEFRRGGADLDAAGKARLRALHVELADVTAKFSQNVVDATAAFEFRVEDEARLSGLPPRAIAAARAAAAARGQSGYRFGLDAPSYSAVLTYADDRSLREAMWRAHATRATSGAHDNRPLVSRILALRAEQARLLGFRDFADLVLHDRMARDGDTAERFVRDLEERTRPAFERETEELRAFHRESVGADAPELAPWDVAYWSEKLRRARFDFDEEDLRPYLVADRCLEGALELARRLYGVTAEPVAEGPTWHPSARAFRLRDEDGALLGWFYVDPYPRETKRDGAWMSPLITGARGEPHAASVCANLTPPSGDGLALVSHRELQTLFHEFGHLLHHLFSDVPVRSLAGTRVAWDFVELPSQIMENWTWERAGLDLVARHHRTGEPLPQDLFERMRRARTFRAASDQMRQLGFATVDLALHRHYDPTRDGDVVAYARRVLQRFSVAPLPEDYAMIAGFGHLFGSPIGYAAGYYSYKWAEVLDADAFDRFLEEGLFSAEVGRAFREHVLSRGDGEDPHVLFRAFRGRDPDPEALLRRTGLVAS